MRDIVFRQLYSLEEGEELGIIYNVMESHVFRTFSEFHTSLLYNPMRDVSPSLPRQISFSYGDIRERKKVNSKSRY